MSIKENENLGIADEKDRFAKLKADGFWPVVSINYNPGSRFVVFGLAEIHSALQVSILTAFCCKRVGTLLLHMPKLSLVILWEAKWHGKSHEIIPILNVPADHAMSVKENQNFRIADQKDRFAKLKADGFVPLASINYNPGSRFVVLGLAEIPSAFQLPILTDFWCERVGTLVVRRMPKRSLVILWEAKWYDKRHEIIPILNVPADHEKLNLVIQ